MAKRLVVQTKKSRAELDRLKKQALNNEANNNDNEADNNDDNKYELDSDNKYESDYDMDEE